MHLAMAIPLTIAATYVCMKAKQKLAEKMPGTPLLSPEEHKEMRDQAFGVTVTPFPAESQQEQETK